MVLSRVWRAFLPVLLGLAVAQCGSDSSGPGTLRPATILLVSGNHQTGTVGQNLAQSLVVRVTASDGRPVPNVAVSWSVTAGGGSLTAASTQTDAAGQATVVWSLGTAAGTNNQSAQAAVAGLTNSPIIFDASAVAAAASQITLVSGNNQTGTVGAAAGTSLVVRVADPFNNPVSGATVTWAVASGGGSVSAPTTPTDASGQASVTWTFGPTAGAQTAAATAVGLTGSPLTFTAQVAAGAATQMALVSGNNQSATVGQALGAPLVVVVRDAFGNPKSGVSVGWAVVAGGGSVSAPASTTDAQGQASVTWTVGTVAGIAQSATAAVAALTGSPVTFSAAANSGAATQLVLVAGGGQSGTVGQALAQPFVVKVTDAFNNPVLGVTVTWAVTAGAGSIAPAAPTTDASGLASATLTLGTGAGTHTATATAGGLAGSPQTFTATGTAAAASQLTLVSGDGQTGTAGLALAQPLVVKVTDAFNNPVSGTAVSWAVTSGGGTPSSATTPTDAQGLASISWTLGGTAGAQGITASSTGLAGSPVSFGATAVAATAADLTLVSGDNQTGTVGTALAAPFTVRVSDAFGNPVAGVTITWAVGGGNGSIAPANVATDAQGLASATLTLGPAAGDANNTATATAPGLNGSPVTFTASAVAGAPSQFDIVSGGGQSAIAGTDLAAPFVVAVSDAFGNPVSGVSVTWAVSAGGGSVSPTSTLTNLAGLASATLTVGTAAGSLNNSVTATAAGFPGQILTFTASVTADVATQLSLASGDAQTGPVGQVLPQTIVVRAQDQYGNPVSGVAVDWAVTSGGGSLSSLSTPTDASGDAAVTWTLGSTAGAQSAEASATGLSGSPVGFTATATAGAAASIAMISGDGQTGTVGATLTNPFVVRVTDTFGNPVAGASVAWTVATGGGSIVPAGPTTDAAGIASATLTLGTGAGAGAHTATATASGLAGSPVGFTANAVADVATQLVRISGDSQSATAGQALASPLVVEARDQFGNPVSGVTVTWGVDVGGGNLSSASTPTDGLGQASVTWTLGLGAGTQDAHAASSGLTGSPIAFTATAVVGAATQLALASGDGQTGTVGSALASPFVVKVTDALGNPVAGTTVTWAVTGGGGNLSSGATPTDGAGLASGTLTLGTAAGSGNNTVTATAGGLAGSPVTFAASASAAGASALGLVSGDAQSGTVGTALANPLVVRVTDGFGNPVAGTTVTWAVTGGGGGLSSAATPTDAAGLASAALTLGTTAGAGNNTVTATAGGLSGSPVTFTASATADAEAQIALVSGNAQTDTVGVALPAALVVDVRDQYGNPVGGVSVAWAVTAGGGNVSQPSVTTNAAGQASVTWTLGTTAGAMQTAEASVSGLSGSPVGFGATAIASHATALAAASGDNQAAAVNATLPQPFVVLVTDTYGNPVQGVTVNWAVTGGGGSIAPPSSVTDAAGHAASTLTLGAVAGADNNTATASSSGLAGSPVTFTASANSAAATTLAYSFGDGQSGTVGQALGDSLEVIVTDGVNPVAGVTVSFTVTSGGGSVSASHVATDGAGKAWVTWTLGPVAGAQTAQASAGGLSGSPVTFTATAAAGTASQIVRVSGNAQSGVVNTALGSAYVVRVTDAFGNGVAGVTVTWAVTGGGGSITPAGPTTDAAGLASATRTLGTTAGANTATASAGGLTGSPVSFTASATPGAATQLTLVSGNNQTGTVNAALASPFVVKVADALGNAIAGVSVAWASTGGGGSIPASSITNALGQASATGTLGTVAGSGNNTATATVGGLAGSPLTFTASATAGAANQISLVSGNGQTGTVNTALASPLVVLVVDAFGNPKSGVTVAWAATAGGGSIPAASITNAAGQAAGTLTVGTSAGTNNNTATATVAGLTGSPVTFNASGSAGAASQISLVSGTGQTGTVNTALAAPFVVKVADAFGNGVSGVTVNWAATAGGGSIPAASFTNAAGQAAGTLTLGTTAGTSNNTATASVGGLSGSPVTFTASATAGAAAQLTLQSGNNQTGTVNAALASAFVVRVSDAFSNPVANTTVNWAVTGGGGTILPLTTTSNASGLASATRTLGTVAGTSNNLATATAAGLAGSPVTFTASATAGAPASVALVSGNNQSGTVGQALASPFVVIVKDAFNNLVSGASVAWAATAGGGSIPASTATNASGLASATLTLGTNASLTNTATATVTGASGSPVTFTATAAAGPAAILALVSGNNQSGTVNTALASPFVVRVTDAFNNPISGHTVTWAATAGGGSIPAASVTNASGQAAGTLTLGTVAGAGNNTATASASGLSGSPVTFTASATAGAAAAIAFVSGNSQTGTVNAALASPFVVRVTDGFGNNVSGHTVTWTKTVGNGSIGASSITNASGLASATLTLGTVAGTSNNAATASGSGLAGSPVTFTASANAGAAAAIALVSGDGQSGVVNTALGAPFLVHVTDAFGNDVAGYSVTWTRTAGGGSIAASSLTGATGLASATLTLGTTAGTSNNTATASGSGLTGSPVTFTASATAGTATAIALVSGNNQSGVVNTSLASPFVVRVTDAFGNNVAGHTVTWAATAGGGSLPANTGTNGSGLASATLTLGTVAGTNNNTATASATGLTGSPVTFTASANAAPAATIALVSGNNQTGTVNTALAAPFVVHVADAFGNDVAGYSVTWTRTVGNGSIPAASATNASGQASATLTLGTVAGAGTDAATASGSGLTGSPVTFTASATAGAAAQLVLVSGNGQAGQVAAALGAPFVIRVTDAFANPVAGTTVNWAVTGGSGSIAPPSGASDAAGLASATLTLGPVAGTNNNTATASAGGLGGSPVTFTASANSSNATQIALFSGNNQTAMVGQALSFPLVVVVKDALDNAVANENVGFAVTAGGGNVSQSNVMTGSDGKASVTWTLGTTAGAQTAQATRSGLTGSPITFSATATPGVASQVVLVSGSGQTGTVGTALGSAFVVRVTDGFGNGVAGVTVSWAATVGGGTITPAAPTTDASGLASATLTLGPTAGAGNNTVTASSTGLTGSPVTFTASANAGAATQLALVSGSGQSGTVAQTLAQPLVVLVSDALGNPVAGVTVTWAVTGGGGNLSAASAPSDGAGHASVTWTLGGVSGANTATATAGGLTGSPVNFTATGVAGAATQIALVSGNGQSATVATALTDSLVVRVRDALNNPVSGVTVTWAATAGGGTITPAAPTTDAAGLAWARLTLGTSAGALRDTVTATSTGLTGSPVVFAATATAAAASQISLSAGNAQTAPAATALPTPLAVLVRDTYGNAVAGVTVAWSAATGGGSVSAPTSITNASGLTSVTRTLGASAGSATTTATVGGLTGSPVTFTATATPNATISGTITTASGYLSATMAATMAASPVRSATTDATSVAGAWPAHRLSPKPARTGMGGSFSGATAPVTPTTQYTPDELIVTYRAAALGAPGVGSPGLRSPTLAQGLGDAIRTKLAGFAATGRLRMQGVSPAILTARVQVADPAQLDQVMADLRNDPSVAAVTRNALVYADATTPNDPLYYNQAWDAEMMDLPRAWSITTGSASVMVAVLDDGIRSDHPAITANLTSDGYDFVSNVTVNKCGGGTIANDGDGGAPGVVSYDAFPQIPQSFTFNSVTNCASGPNATGGHGLHVAGTIGAVGNDGVGTTGVNWTVKIRPVRVLGVAGVGTTYDIAQGILYAAGLPADNGHSGTVTAPSAAKIINMSLAGPTSDTTMHSAVISAANAGVLIVAAAGNAGTSAPNYPAAYPEVLSVTAVGPDGQLASYSSFGSTVDIAAPGGDIADGGGDASFGITSTFWSFASSAPLYASLQGTSMAAPHVAGAAALLLAQTPSLTAAQLRSRLQTYAVDAGVAGPDDQYGAGIVNARNALTQTFAPPAQLYARLYNATTGALVATTTVAGNGSYAFTALPDGSYYVYAGEDESSDGQVGIPGRRWGAFGGSSVPSGVVVTGAGTYAASFTVALPLETELAGPSPDDDNDTTPEVLVVGGYVNADIDAGDSDVLRVYIATAGTYTFETSGQHGQCGYALEADTQVLLYDASLNSEGSSDDISGTNFCSSLTVALTPGLHYVQVLGFTPSPTDVRRYRLQVRSGS